MSVAQLNYLEFKELPIKSGKTSTGYELHLGEKVIKLYDFVLTKFPGLKLQIADLMDVALPKMVEVSYRQDGNFMVLDSILLADGVTPMSTHVNPAIVNRPTTKIFNDRGARNLSIERQSAINAACTLVGNLCKGDVVTIDLIKEHNTLAEVIVNIAARFVSYHQEHEASL